MAPVTALSLFVGSASSQGGGDPVFGGRPPRVCPNISHPPSAAEAAVLVQCSTEGAFGTIEVLMTSVQVQMLGSRAFDIHQDQWAPSVDTRTRMYLLKGSAQNYTCSRKIDMPPGQNCHIQQYHDAPGACWKTTGGPYRCGLQGGTTGFVVNQPPPNGY